MAKFKIDTDVLQDTINAYKTVIEDIEKFYDSIHNSKNNTLK